MKVFEISIHSHHYIPEAIEFLKNNRVIAGVSDTLFGLFSILSPENAKILHMIKKRDSRKPFLMVVPQNYDIYKLVEKINDSEKLKFIEEKWPGRNTLVLNKKKGILYPPSDSIALRKPAELDNPWFYELIQKIGRPLLAPSLNIHEKEPMKNLDEIERIFGSQIDALFYPVEKIHYEAASNIFDLTSKTIQRLR